MIKTTIIFAFALIYNLTIHAQKNNLKNPDSIEIVLNQKAEGFGPRGNASISFSPKKSMDSLELSACPKMKNIPDNLIDVEEYCFQANRFQFFYQNYRKGIFPKDYFLKEAAEQKWNLKDTIQLTEKPLKNTISIVTGINSDGIPMYIVDSQNNGDFGDDTITPLLTSSYKQEEVVRNSNPVAIDYLDGENIKTYNQLIYCHLSRSKREKQFLEVSFPQFRFNKFNYKNKSYLVCKEFSDYYHSVYIVNDRPYFYSINDKEVRPFQFVELDGDYFEYVLNSQNSEKIVLKKVARPKEGTLPVAGQMAMSAPEISGINVLNGLNVSLNASKGKYVFIDFWSTSCGSCIADFPNIKEVYQKYDRNQLEIIGVVDDRTRDGKIKEFIEKRDLPWPNINMNIKSTNIKNYNIRSYPTSYLINPKGVIIATNLRGDELMNKLQSLKIENR